MGYTCRIVTKPTPDILNTLLRMLLGRPGLCQGDALNLEVQNRILKFIIFW